MDFFLAEFWISAPQGFSEANFQCNFGHFSVSFSNVRLILDNKKSVFVMPYP